MTFRDTMKERLHHDLGFDFYRKDGAPIKTFRIISKGSGFLCGTIFIPTIVRLVDEEFFLDLAEPSPEMDIKFCKNDGDPIAAGDHLAELRGNAEVLLKAERTICDILSELSGIATQTKKEMEKIAHLGAILLDTRKDNPLLRPMHKYAIRIGGGSNHRSGFFDGILIKDNDIATYGGIQQAIEKSIHETRFLTRREIEVRNLKELAEVLRDGRVDAIMLDHMEPDMLREAVSAIRTSGTPYLIEVSGISENNIQEIAKIGVSSISTSSLIRKAEYIDISMKVIND